MKGINKMTNSDNEVINLLMNLTGAHVDASGDIWCDICNNPNECCICDNSDVCNSPDECCTCDYSDDCGIIPQENISQFVETKQINGCRELTLF